MIENQEPNNGGGISLRIAWRAVNRSDRIARGVGFQREHFITGVKNTPLNITKPNLVISPNLIVLRFIDSIIFRIKLICSLEQRVPIAGVNSQTLKVVFASLDGEASC